MKILLTLLLLLVGCSVPHNIPKQGSHKKIIVVHKEKLVNGKTKKDKQRIRYRKPIRIYETDTGVYKYDKPERSSKTIYQTKG